jgi:hypothetical protein
MPDGHAAHFARPVHRTGLGRRQRPAAEPGDPNGSGARVTSPEGAGATLEP